jgi:hypothetical protein
VIFYDGQYIVRGAVESLSSSSTARSHISLHLHTFSLGQKEMVNYERPNQHTSNITQDEG